MLYYICQELTNDNLTSLKYVSNLSKPKLDAIKDPEDLVLSFEKLILISPNNLDELVTMLMEVNRQDLVDKIKQYTTNYHRTVSPVVAPVVVTQPPVQSRQLKAPLPATVNIDKNIAISHRQATVLSSSLQFSMQCQQMECDRQTFVSPVHSPHVAANIASNELTPFSTRDDKMIDGGDGSAATSDEFPCYSLTRNIRGQLICCITLPTFLFV